MASTAPKDPQPPTEKSKPRRKPLKQSDVPGYPLDEALRVPLAIADNYAKRPTKPLDVAMALNMSVNSGPFRMLTGAALAYGLTDGGAQADMIALTDLGKRIVAPTQEGDDLAAKRQALMQPRIVREFMEQYDGSPLPKDQIARNVLEEMGVPVEATADALSMILENGRSLGLITDYKGRTYIRLDNVTAPPQPEDDDDADLEDPTDATGSADPPGTAATNGSGEVQAPLVKVDPQDLSKNKRVFITHGRNRDIVGQLKELLTFGGMEPVVSVETDTVAKPVPVKVLDEMRSCGAAIVHVGMEQRLLDDAGKEHRVVNPNVLIEIGAAMALYERRFILLVEKGVTLPSNLQGLYEVRYEGDKLDYEATMKLLRAFNEFKSAG